MSRRSIIVLVVLIGVVATFLLWKKENLVTSHESEISADSSAAESQLNSKADSKPAQDRKLSSNTHESSFSSSEQIAEVPERGPRSGNTPLPRVKSFNAAGAKWSEDPLLKGTSWKIWTGVTAYPKSAGEPTSGRLLGEINNHYLVDEGFVADTTQFTGKPIVVIDPQDGRAGVLTGTVGLVLEEGANAGFLTQAPNLKVLGAFPDINTYYVTSAQLPFDLRAFQEALRAEPEVKDLHLEILSRQHEKF